MILLGDLRVDGKITLRWMLEVGTVCELNLTSSV
jgi:hypothetical protein